jgi:hypothetical protein
VRRFGPAELQAEWKFRFRPFRFVPLFLAERKSGEVSSA